ncbi:DUF1826 domain-containing protein [Paracoccus methylarcula]|nr:DUF1826 domain-containing protein [Paracoccus methylarcula]
MTPQADRRATAVNSSTDPRILGSITMNNVAVAIWQRPPVADFLAWLEELAPARLPRLRCRLPPAWVTEAVAHACDEAGTPPGLHRDMLVADIAELARRAADVTGAMMVDLRLDVSSGQPCPKWHLDAVSARLLCTLRGAGTQFGPARPNGDPANIWQMRPGDVGMFRGRLWPGNGISGILHRSPPAGNGPERLLVVIDPVDEAGSC